MSLKGKSKGSGTSDSYDLVFSNKTVLDPVRASSNLPPSLTAQFPAGNVTERSARLPDLCSSALR